MEIKMELSALPPRVAAIVLSYNGLDLTLDCLASLLYQDYPRLDVILVDNHSQDGTVEAVSTKFPEVQVIASPENLGYASGNNLGMQTAMERGCEVFFLVNNDTRLSPDCVSTLVSALENNPSAGAAGPMVYTFEGLGRISSAGGKIDWRYASAINVGAGEIDQAQYPARPVDFINGCGFMVTRKVVQRVGMLDPKYFMYWEETDWSMRLQQAGFQLLFVPQAHMEHRATLVDNEQSPTTLYYLTRNRLLFFSRYSHFPTKLLTLYSAVHGAMLGIGKHRQAGRIVHAKATRLAIWHAFKRQWGRTEPQSWSNEPRGLKPCHSLSGSK
jgi:GT2 family glycosyltransferase